MAAAIGAGALAAGLAVQHGMGLEPCPLCIFQRVAFIAAAAPAGAGALWAAARPRSKGASALLALAAALAAAGVAIAARHMYVMWVPQDSACGPDLEYLMDSFPPSKWLPKVFAGEAECSAAANQPILWLPIPVWSAMLFAGQAASALRAAILCGRSPKA